MPTDVDQVRRIVQNLQIGDLLSALGAFVQRRETELAAELGRGARARSAISQAIAADGRELFSESA